MRCVSAFRLKESVAAVILSSCIAGGIGAVTSPGVAANAEAITIAVNRASKGDRLPPQAPIAQRSQPNSPSTDITHSSPKTTPLGCDPAFSPVADPVRAHIYKRCMA
jgi:hypothetical protein